MRTSWILSTAVVAMSVTAAVGAQSTKAMGKPSMSLTYTGCVESVNDGGTFLLTKVDSVGAGVSVAGLVIRARKNGANDKSFAPPA